MKTIENRIARTIVLVVSLMMSVPVFGQNTDAVDPNLALEVGYNETEVTRSSVGPLLETHWKQDGPYNQYCPWKKIGNNQVRALTGCVPTAMAQLLYYYKQPVQEISISRPFFSMVDTLEFENNITSVIFDDDNPSNNKRARKYAFRIGGWNYNSSNQQELAAMIMRDCGIAVACQYGLSASGAFSVPYKGFKIGETWHKGFHEKYGKWQPTAYDVFKDYFGFPNAIFKEVNFGNENTIIDEMKKYLNNGDPIYLSYTQYNGMRHAAIIDGYYERTSNEIIFYINMGDGYMSSIGQDFHQILLSSKDRRAYIIMLNPEKCNVNFTNGLASKDQQTTNQIIYESVTKYHEYIDAMTGFISDILSEVYWQDEEKSIDFWNLFQSLLDSNTGMITEDRILQLISQSPLDSISEDYIRFISEGYNQSVMYWNEGYYTNESLPEAYEGMIEYDTAAMRKAYEAQAYAESLGFNDVREMYDNAYEMLEAEIENNQSEVCARVTVQFAQQMTMTREAFNGTLQIFNGHESIPMQDILVDFRIKDPQGNDCTSLFQINTLALDQITGISGNGSLAAQTNGTALVQFIPTRNAAPTEPVVYSFGGSFSFIDPFTGEGLTYPLYPVDITVNPSPDLRVDYFMQRDIIGDDALTTDVVEPTVPAELGVIIHNKGAGTANNVVLETAEPQIIDNEHGLAIDFAMYGASFNGSLRQLGLMEIPFGNIGSGQTAVGEWLFTSSLLGHFVSYNAHVIHNSSYGNADLSLVSHLDIHELVHPIYAYGSLDDGINDFLVNDNPDAYDTPDSIYFSHGGKTSVAVVDDISFDHYVVTPQDTIVTLTLVPSRAGWNYGITDDPGMNEYEIVSCIRNNDNQEIPLNNVWQTFVTIPDGGDPVYENKLHIVDTIPVGQTTTYTLVYAKSANQNNSVAQATTLTEGWNWWSTYINMSTEQDFNKLKTALGSNASMIKSRTDGFVTYMGDWYGTLQTINNQSMYMINMNSEQTISLIGTRANLATTPITINPGWNWIGFPSNVSVDINSALVHMTPAESDLIKTRNAFATYYSSIGGWYGSLTSLTPGLGYMYQSNNEESFEFIYSTIARNDMESLEVQKSNHWEISVGEYSDNATLIGVIAINGEEQRDENLIVGAFVGNRCVGEANAIYVEPFDRYLVFLTYFGNENDEITFRLYDENSGIETIGAETSLVFNTNSMIGSLEEPLVINFTMTMNVNEFAKNAKLFPNPVKALEKVNVGLKNVDASSMMIEIVNTLGMVVYQKTYHSTAIDITAPRLPGIYIVKVTEDKGNVYYGKLIVE